MKSETTKASTYYHQIWEDCHNVDDGEHCHNCAVMWLSDVMRQWGGGVCDGVGCDGVG